MLFFLPCDAVLSRYTLWPWVRPSVRPSQVRVLRLNVWITQHRHAIPIVFWMPTVLMKCQQILSQRGCQNTGGVGKHRRFSTNTSLYFSNGARWGRSYYRRLVGTPVRSIEWCYIQWPWMTSNYPKPPQFLYFLIWYTCWPVPAYTDDKTIPMEDEA